MNHSPVQIYHRIAIAANDLSVARSILELIGRVTTRSEWEEYFLRVQLKSMAIVSYCKPFKRSRGSAAPLITIQEYAPDLVDELRQAHGRIIELRDGLVAHSDSEWHPMGPLRDAAGSPQPTGYTLKIGYTHINELGIELFQQLASQVELSVSERALEMATVLRARGEIE